MDRKKTVYEEWQDGNIQGELALTELYKSLDTNKDSLEAFKETEKVLRTQISQVVEKDFNGFACIEGVAQLKITEPGKTVSYDWRKLDALVIQLTNAGYHELARDITQCRSESGRVGSLRIDPIRQR